ncbi:hypothetical protein [Ralstonia phage phiRSL1]|uniref:Uncharacterized protein n=1 Tax=Ralstonia phage phiRSL1 TaxID=1980924 RepID=B2ZXT9_9CAUD|nr:hypothetical protein RSL1_ORF069 [Ralstonia phage phiRSL1]BAG41515.1 hypothetical protein [Ralstonia phage phiRSL1]
MSMYTQFWVGCRLKADTPATMVALIKDLIGDNRLKSKPNGFAEEMARSPEGARYLSDHRHFYLGHPVHFGSGAEWLLEEAIKDHDPEATDWDFHTLDDGTHFLLIGTVVPNYQGVLEKFLAWIGPWIVEPVGTEIGQCLYEEYQKPSPVVVGEELKTGTRSRDEGGWWWPQ